MKVLFTTIILLFITSAYSQDSTKRLTKFEEFGNENGVLMKSQTIDMGKVKGFIMSKWVSTNIETGETLKAVQVSERVRFLGYAIGSTILIDEEEIPAVIKTLKYFLSNVTNDPCKENCPSYTYRTYGGVSISCTKFIGAYGSNWHIYIGRWGVPMIDLDPKEFENFLKLLESYK